MPGSTMRKRVHPSFSSWWRRQLSVTVNATICQIECRKLEVARRIGASISETVALIECFRTTVWRVYQ